MCICQPGEHSQDIVHLFVIQDSQNKQQLYPQTTNSPPPYTYELTSEKGKSVI